MAPWMFSDHLNSIQVFPGISEVLTVLLAELSPGCLAHPVNKRSLNTDDYIAKLCLRDEGFKSLFPKDAALGWVSSGK